MNGEVSTINLADASLLRLAFFAGILLLMAVLERTFPCRDRLIRTSVRWANNLALVFVNSVLMRLIIPVSLLWFADYVALQQWGLFNILSVPYWVAFAASLILLDLAIYGQHRLFHAVPVLWRLHRLHHADLDIDVTTGLRFHPIEILLSMAIKFGLVAAIGAPAVAVLVFEVVLNGMSIFNHANLKLPVGMDRLLRIFVATPDFHRVHHSDEQAETNSNYGFNLSWWDHLFGTYRAQPGAGHDGMTIGLKLFRETRDLRLDRMLWQPLRSNTTPGKDAEEYP